MKEAFVFSVFFFFNQYRICKPVVFGQRASFCKCSGGFSVSSPLSFPFNNSNLFLLLDFIPLVVFSVVLVHGSDKYLFSVTVF